MLTTRPRVRSEGNALAHFRYRSHPNSEGMIAAMDEEGQRISELPTSEGVSSPPPSPMPGADGRREYWITLGGIVGALALVVLAWIVMGEKQTTTPAVPQAHRPAPDFSLPTPEGEIVRLSDHRGAIVLVNFWGSWCDPCRKELPELQAAYERLRDRGFVVIGVNLFNNEFKPNGSRLTGADVRAFVAKHGVTYPIALDERGEVATAYQIYPIPTSFFIDRSGNIRYVVPREITAEEILQWFTSLDQPS